MSDNTFTTAWGLSSGGTLQGTSSFDGDSNFAPIPDDTMLHVMIEEALWDEYEGERKVKIKWRVMGTVGHNPTTGKDPFANRVVFDNVRIFHNENSKADRHKHRFASIVFNCNATDLLQKPLEAITDVDLMKLNTKAMLIKVGVFNERNWVKAVGMPKQNTAPSQPQQPAQPQQQAQAPQMPDFDNFNGDVPF